MDKLPAQAVSGEQAGLTLAALLRVRMPGVSWSRIKALIDARRVTVRGELCRDPARRLKEGDVVELLARPLPPPRSPEEMVLRHLDEHLVVVEKPAGMNTVRHPAELQWTQRRKELSPTLQDLVPAAIARRTGHRGPRLRVVHRLDKETSGLLVFARSVAAESGLGKQFHAHTVVRRYLAIVWGHPSDGVIRSTLVRDRGDGRRGSGEGGKLAVTHVETVEDLGSYSLVRCRLETGRTHQIRIHLSEQGHPVAGDKVYHLRADGVELPDGSGASRLMLHAAELGFTHPITGETLHWEMGLPSDMQQLLARLRKGA
ncbi:MAG: RluA family pseudouridine synthase [Gemmataceae bacterium]